MKSSLTLALRVIPCSYGLWTKGLEYYAYEADKRNQTVEAKRNHRLLARKSFREFVYQAVGYKPVNPEEVAALHPNRCKIFCTCWLGPRMATSKDSYPKLRGPIPRRSILAFYLKVLLSMACTLDLREIDGLSIINIVVDKSVHQPNYDPFEKSWTYLIQRMENTIYSVSRCCCIFLKTKTNSKLLYQKERRGKLL